MTIDELIVELQQLDPKLPVCINNGEFDEELTIVGSIVHMRPIGGELIGDSRGRKYLYLGCPYDPSLP
jgi:hypothetical protein